MCKYPGNMEPGMRMEDNQFENKNVMLNELANRKDRVSIKLVEFYRKNFSINI